MSNQTNQQIASIVRQVGASVISAGYATLVAAGHTKGIPAAVDGVIVAFGPAVVILEHYLSDPSTGNSTTPAPPDPVTLPAVTGAVESVAAAVPAAVPTVEAWEARLKALEQRILPATTQTAAGVTLPPPAVPSAWSAVGTGPVATAEQPVPTVPVPPPAPTVRQPNAAPPAPGA